MGGGYSDTNPPHRKCVEGAEHHLQASYNASNEDHVPMWPDMAAAQRQGFPVWPYHFKIWRCGQLILSHARSYDFVIRLRPDLRPSAPWNLTWLPTEEPARFQLTVGETTHIIGPREVVMPTPTYACANDWLHVSHCVCS